MPAKGRNEWIKDLRHFPVEGGEMGTKMSKNAHAAAKNICNNKYRFSQSREHVTRLCSDAWQHHGTKPFTFLHQGGESGHSVLFASLTNICCSIDK